MLLERQGFVMSLLAKLRKERDSCCNCGSDVFNISYADGWVSRIVVLDTTPYNHIVELQSLRTEVFKNALLFACRAHQKREVAI